MMRRMALVTWFILLSSLSASIQDKFNYLHPKPNAQYVNTQTNLILRWKHSSTVDQLEFLVNGSKSGEMSGELRINEQPFTYIYDPHVSFQSEELVTVTILMNDQQFIFSFNTAQPGPRFYPKASQDLLEDPVSSERQLHAFGEPTIFANGVSVPSDFPYLNITVNDDSDSGKIILNRRDSNAPYILIFNNDGSPFWYQRVDYNMREFKKQATGLLTGLTMTNDPYFGLIPGSYIGMDSTYAVVDSFYSGPGTYIDEHDLLVLPNGHYLVIAEEKVGNVDVSDAGGSSNAFVELTNLQELDENDQVVWEWRSLDHFKFTDTDPAIQDITRSSFDFPHINSIDIDDDGHLVISSRHTSEITKIHRETGNIIWRLGGSQNQFTFINDFFNGFSSQHDAKCLGNGHYTVFDNGNGHQPPESRGVEYVLDTDAMTATLVWEYRSEPRKFAWRFGNVQQLPNDNKLINWGAQNYPRITEVRPDGSTAYEMNFERPSECYRVHRESWNAPAIKPYLLVESGTVGTTLIFNQFGDETVDYYKLYHGLTPEPTVVLDTSQLTLKTFTDLENKREHYFRVTAVSRSGEESEFSNEEVVLVKVVEPGDNQVLNHDFSEQEKYWEFFINGNVTASAGVEDGFYHVHIEAFNDPSGMVYFRQVPIEVKRNESYVFEFEAWASETMRIQPAVVHSLSGTDYSQIGEVQISSVKKMYSYEFSPRSSNTEAALAFFMTDKAGHIYIDNIVLRHIVNAVEHDMDSEPLQYQLSNAYPNPFNGTTTMKFIVPVKSSVTMTLYNLLGKEIRQVKKGSFEPGEHQVVFQDESLSSGVYFFHMKAESFDGEQSFHQVVKTVFLK
ncbi:aryl-sulfate sulfotransferase [bacterium]